MSKPPFIKVLRPLALAAVISAVPTGCTPHSAPFPRDRDALLAACVYVPPGSYPAGSGEEGCYPRTNVVTRGFYIWPTEVSTARWSEYTGSEADNGGEYPASGLSYEEAEAFCAWLSDRYGVNARLPTTDEWQIAARPGKGGVTYSWGWTDRPPPGELQPAKSGRPNERGLYHMSGNVAEWCAAQPASPTAPVMGGSWAERDSRFFRVSHRLELDKTYRNRDVGFRFVIDAPE